MGGAFDLAHMENLVQLSSLDITKLAMFTLFKTGSTLNRALHDVLQLSKFNGAKPCFKSTPLQRLASATGKNRAQQKNLPLQSSLEPCGDCDGRTE